MSRPRRSNPAPVAASTPADPDEPGEPGAAPGGQKGRLTICLETAPGVGALGRIRAAIARLCPQPCRFLGAVNGRLSLQLDIGDPGGHAAERLALRIFRIAGIDRVRAERRCPRRGVVYAIHLAPRRD